MIRIENLTLDDWYTCLKPYQKNAITQLVEKYGEEAAAKEWIMSRGPVQTATFGGENNEHSKKTNYWINLKNEFHKFICGDLNYEKERTLIISTGDVIGLKSLVPISVFFSPIIGLPVSILTPAIVILLHSAAKMGIQAYCSNLDTNE